MDIYIYIYIYIYIDRVVRSAVEPQAKKARTAAGRGREQLG
jgi:hypothetical protein